MEGGAGIERRGFFSSNATRMKCTLSTIHNSSSLAGTNA